MNRRAVFHDYGKPGTYMVTLAVADRRPLLGALVEEPHPRIALSPLGAAIEREEIPKISRHYPQVEVWRYCIMPDHIHFILRVKAAFPEGSGLGRVVNGFKAGCNRARNTLAQSAREQDAGFQFPCALRKGGAREQDAGLFERGYNDRLLFDGEQLSRWKRYLDDNPRRLALKRKNPDFFTVINEIEINGTRCKAVGNRFLLDVPDKAAVIVHRRWSDAEYQGFAREWMACGERGGVLVSANISPMEKAVMREAYNRGYSVIALRDNGFPALYKPSGAAFDACAEGRLLQISPWEYHSEKRAITREQCLFLNRLAEEIAGNPHA